MAELRLRKVPDTEAIALMAAVIKGLQAHKVTIRHISFQIEGIASTNELDVAKWQDHKAIDKLLTNRSEVLNSVTLAIVNPNNQNDPASVQYIRDRNHIFIDKFLINLTHDLPEDISIACWNVASDATAGMTMSSPDNQRLGQALEEHFTLRDQRLRVQEQSLAEFFSEMGNFTRKITEEGIKRQEQLDQKHGERMTELDNQHATRLEGLTRREEELATKIKEFDTRESKGHRRRIADKMQEELATLLKGFQLSATVQKKRIPVHFGLIAGTAVSAGVAAFLFSLPVVSTTGGYDFVLIGRQVAACLVTVAFISFYITWVNRWFNRNADAEFQYKRLALDMSRASWLVEMILEWREDHKENPDAEFPEQLMRELSKGLFVEGAAADPESNPTAQMMKSLFGHASNIELTLPGKALKASRTDGEK